MKSTKRLSKSPCIKCLYGLMHPFHDNGKVHTNHMPRFLAESKWA